MASARRAGTVGSWSARRTASRAAISAQPRGRAAARTPGRGEKRARLLEGAARASGVPHLSVELGELAQDPGVRWDEGREVLERGDAVPDDARALGRAQVEGGDRRIAGEEHHGTLRALDRRRPVTLRMNRPLPGRSPARDGLPPASTASRAAHAPSAAEPAGLAVVPLVHRTTPRARCGWA